MTTKTKTSARRTSKTAKVAKSARRSINIVSPRTAIRAKLEEKDRDAAFKFGIKLPGMTEATVRRYIAFFLSKKGKAEAKASAKRAAKKAA